LFLEFPSSTRIFNEVKHNIQEWQRLINVMIQVKSDLDFDVKFPIVQFKVMINNFKSNRFRFDGSDSDLNPRFIWIRLWAF
jgi:hypothetical protein